MREPVSDRSPDGGSRRPRGLFDHGSLCCIGPDAEGTWRYLPLTGDVRRDATGHSSLTFVDLAESGFLMLTGTWQGQDGSVEALRGVIAERIGEEVPARIRIGFAPVHDVSCHLMAALDGDQWVELAVSQTSGLPPYDALFSVSLTGAALAAFRAAANGERDRLLVRYDALLPRTVRATASLMAVRAVLRRWLDDHDALDPRQAVDQAVQEGIASVRVDSLLGEAEFLMNDLYERLLSEVAHSLPAVGTQETGDLVVTVTLERQLDQQLEVLADLAGVLEPTPM